MVGDPNTTQDRRFRWYRLEENNHIIRASVLPTAPARFQGVFNMIEIVTEIRKVLPFAHAVHDGQKLLYVFRYSI